jgi:hypothetical protein
VIAVLTILAIGGNPNTADEGDVVRESDHAGDTGSAGDRQQSVLFGLSTRHPNDGDKPSFPEV